MSALSLPHHAPGPEGWGSNPAVRRVWPCRFGAHHAECGRSCGCGYRDCSHCPVCGYCGWGHAQGCVAPAHGHAVDLHGRCAGCEQYRAEIASGVWARRVSAAAEEYAASEEAR